MPEIFLVHTITPSLQGGLKQVKILARKHKEKGQLEVLCLSLVLSNLYDELEISIAIITHIYQYPYSI